MGANRKHLAMTITPNKWELDVQGYLNVCNITDATPRKQIRDFSAGVNDLGLWNSMVCWPLRSSQNYGSGTTAYSLGGLGTFNGTLVNGPSWGVDGVTFDAVSQFAHVPDVVSSEPLNVFVRRSGSTPAVSTALIAQWAAPSSRSWMVRSSNSDATKLRIDASSDGSVGGIRTLDAASGTFPTSDTTVVGVWADGSDALIFSNKTQLETTVFAPGLSNTRINVSIEILINGVGTVASPSGFAGGLYRAVAIVPVSMTSGQREQMTDLINAL